MLLSCLTYQKRRTCQGLGSVTNVGHYLSGPEGGGGLYHSWYSAFAYNAMRCANDPA